MVYCSRKCQIFSSTICAVLQAGIFILAMLVPYIILQAQNAGVTKLVVVDQNSFSAQKWADYTTSTLDMTYYLWNASNLNAVLSDPTGNTKLKWQEAGPYLLTKVTTLDFDSGTSSASASPFIQYRKVTSFKIPDPKTRSRLTDPIVGVNALWIGAVAKGARGLYTQLVASQAAAAIPAGVTQGLAQAAKAGLNASDPAVIQQVTAQVKQVAAQTANNLAFQQLYPNSLNSERLFHAVLAGLLVNGSAPQFTGVEYSGNSSAPDMISPGGSRLLSALRILSVGSYLQGAITTLGADPSVIAVNAAYNLSASPTTAFSAFVTAWATGAPAVPSEATYSPATVAATKRLASNISPFSSTGGQFFLDFELTQPGGFNGTSVVALSTAAKLFAANDASQTSVSLLSLTGLRTWGAYLICLQETLAGTGCSAQETAATKLITATLGADLKPVLGWLLPLIDADPATPAQSPNWRRTYTLTTLPNNAQVYLYTAKSPRERFQQIIVAGIAQGVSDAAAATQAFFPSYAFNPADYPFATNGAIASNETAALAQAQASIQSFYDLAILQFATGWIVSFALKPPATQLFKGVAAASTDALGPSAGFGSALNLPEPIEFPQAVQLVDPTLAVASTRLTFNQAQALLKYVQGRDQYRSYVTPSIIGFALTVDATILGIQQVARKVKTQLQAAIAAGGPSAAVAAQALQSFATNYGPYAKLRTVNVFEAVPILNDTLTQLGQPGLGLINIWTAAKAKVVSSVNSTAFTDAMDQVLLFSILGINPATLSGNFRAVADYFHTYFRRLQEGVGPDAGQYAINGNANPNNTQVIEEAYNSAYGVSKRTNGLFIQRTAYEMLFGSRSHIPGNDIQTVLDQHESYLDESITALNAGLVDGNQIGNQNPIYLDDISQYQSANYDPINGLQAAINRTRIVMTGKATLINTGRADVNQVGVYAAYNGVHQYSTRCEYDNPGNSSGPIISNARVQGEVLFTACPQSTDGGVTHDPSDWLVFNNGWIERIDGVANDPTQFQPFHEGDDKIQYSVRSFISEVQRVVTLNYTGTTVFKGITLRRYVLDSKYLIIGDSGSASNPFKNSDYRQVNEPGFVEASPDGTVSALFMAGAPVVISKPHFLGGDQLALFAPWADGSFNPTPALHETYIDVDPLSGKTFHGQKRLQANIEVRRSVMDASPHLEPLIGNLIYQQTGVDQSFYMPWYWGEEAGAIKDDDASSYRTSIYQARDAGKIIQIVVGIVSAIMFVLSVILVVRACTRQPDTTTSGGTADK